MKINLQVTSLETGGVKDIVIDVESESAAIEMYKGTKLHAEVIPEKESPNPTTSKLFGFEIPKWVAGREGANGLIRGLAIVFGICCIPFVIFAVLQAAQRNPSPPGVIKGLVASAGARGVGLANFLIIHYLRKIANKSD